MSSNLMCSVSPMIEAGERAGDVGAQGENAVFRESFQAGGRGLLGIDLAFGKIEVDAFPFETRGRENGVDVLEKGTLLAIVNRAIDARKCWTKGGLVGDGVHSSMLDLVL